MDCFEGRGARRDSKRLSRKKFREGPSQAGLRAVKGGN